MQISETHKKILLFLLVVALNSFGYTAAQALRPEGMLLQTPLDAAIPFIPQFVLAYGLYIPIGLLPFFLYWRDYKGYRTVALSLAAVLAVSILIFLTFQTSIARAAVDPSAGLFEWGVATVYSWDKPVNAFPSLHVAIPTIATLFIYLRNRKLGLYVLPFTVLVILSTVFIKQHSVVDIAGGLILAFAVFRLRGYFSR